MLQTNQLSLMLPYGTGVQVEDRDLRPHKPERNFSRKEENRQTEKPFEALLNAIVCE